MAGKGRKFPVWHKAISYTPKLPEYDKDSPFIPAAVRKAINDKKRPTEGIESMVERIVDDCREKVPGLQRCMFNTVAESLVSKKFNYT
jgi:hypothetical protein